MGRMLVYVPRMYSREEFQRLANMVPSDFDEKEEEFWKYVEEQLRTLSGRIRRVYRDGLSHGGEEGFKHLNPENPDYALIRWLVENGAELHPTEDPLMVAETESWIEMLKTQPNPTLLELHQESIKERDGYIVNTINQTLKEDEIGVILIEPAHKLSLPEDIKVIKMCRFEPEDYLNIELQKSRLETNK
ncbi:MAG: hypothetical protein ABIH76_00685 [Candidatus Bathyarchaeota archaeon]